MDATGISGGFNAPMSKRQDQRMFDNDGEARDRLIVWIRRRMEEYGISLEALAESLDADREAQTPMYRDAYGNTWDGKGDKPEWLARAIHAGQDMEHFRC